MKYILILYMCSMVTGQCPTSTISGWQFDNYVDCVDSGYGVSQKTFRSLEVIEEWDREYLEQSKIVVKFECKEVGTNT